MTELHDNSSSATRCCCKSTGSQESRKETSSPTVLEFMFSWTVKSKDVPTCYLIGEAQTVFPLREHTRDSKGLKWNIYSRDTKSINMCLWPYRLTSEYKVHHFLSSSAESCTRVGLYFGNTFASFWNTLLWWCCPLKSFADVYWRSRIHHNPPHP